MQFLDDEPLEQYMFGFYGYGDLSGGTWLVGMEEGGGESADVIARRLDAWARRGRPQTDDVAAFHEAADLPQWFRPGAPLQPTWRMLIRLVLSAAADGTGGCDIAAVRDFQGRRLGRIGQRNCLLELLPLPSPRSSAWFYATCSQLPCLRSRRAYESHVAPRRVQRLQELLNEHRPERVVFYGLEHQPWFEQITQRRFETTSLKGLLATRSGSTSCVLTKHPTSIGASNAWFEQAGRMVARM